MARTKKPTKADLAAEVERLERLLREERGARLERETALLLSLIAVLDSLMRLERVMDSGDLDDGAKRIIERYRLVRRKLENALEREGVRRINSLGQSVNPELHQVHDVRDEPGAAPGTIIEVEEEGYLHGGAVLRPAIVTIAGAPAEAAAATDEDA